MIRNVSNRLIVPSRFVLRNKRQLSSSQHASKVRLTSEHNYYTPEEGYVRGSPYDPIELTNLPVDQFVWQNVSKWQNKVAAVCGFTGRQYTYSQMRDHSAALAVNLQQKFGLQKGDVIAVCLPNVPEFPIVALGALEAGLTVTTINPIYTADEISKQLESSAAKIIFGIPESYETLVKATQKAGNKTIISCVRISNDAPVPTGAVDFSDISNPKSVNFSDLKVYDTSSDEIAFLPYSSGTTGLPKGVMLTHKNITSNCSMLNVPLPVEPVVAETTDSYQAVLPCVLPFFHIYGLTVTLLSKLQLGTKIVTLPKFVPDLFIKAVVEHQGTLLHLVPPIVLFLANHPTVEPKHLKSVELVMSGAAPLGASDAERFLKKAPHIHFLQGYGLTETSVGAIMCRRGMKNYNTVGHVISLTEVKIVRPDDPLSLGLGPNETGELLVRGPQIMAGYLNNPKATQEAILPNGWLRTGDIAHYDDDECFYITDRLKELIKVKGFQVPPAELEAIIRTHPDVNEAAVVATPDKCSGEVPRAFVIKKTGSKVSEKELQAFVDGQTAEYKHLVGGVQFVDEIPKNAAGKILRREIKRIYNC